MKERFKLYKAGKLWITACVIVFGLFGATSVQADDQPTNNDNQSDVTALQTTHSARINASQDDTDNTNVSNINGYTEQDNNGAATWQNANGDKANGWQSNQTDWYYFNNGQIQTNWQYINNNWYYLNPNSYAMETGLQTINSSKYYLNEKHDGTYGAMQTGWQLLNNNWYYFANNGAASTGWQRLNNNWYYFDPSTVIMQAGLKQINNHGYYLNDQIDGTYGAMKYGWQKINGRWYGFGGANDGSAYTGWNYLGNHWYYFNDGEARTNWQQINGHRYYFDPTNAWAVTGWQYLNNNWYYFDPNNAWLMTGWTTINGKQYYLNPITGKMATGVTQINNSTYYFDPVSGVQQKGFILDSTANHLMYFDENTGNIPSSITINGNQVELDSTTGIIPRSLLVNGLNQIGSSRFFINNGTFNANSWHQLDGLWYYFNDNGVAETGWYKSNASFWYYFDNTGKAQTGWQKINGHWYLFDDTNANAYTGWFQSDSGNWYYFDPVNAWADTDWHFLNGTWYYFDPTDAWLNLNKTLNYNWQQVMGSYWNSSSIAIQLQRNGDIYSTTNNPGLQYEVASTVKVAVLAMLLHNTNGNLDATQQSLAMKMIRNSDNDATTTILTHYLGGITSLSVIYNALGMNQTAAAPHWGSSLTVPIDQLKLLNMIYLDPSSNYLNEQSKNYIKWLMSTVSPEQQWGISAGSSSYYLKNGWRTASDNGLWEVNSIGYIPNGKNSYTIAIYTRNNRNFNWGVNYVEDLARITKKIIG